MAIDNQASKHMKPLVMKYYVIIEVLNVDPRKQYHAQFWEFLEPH